LTIKSIFNYILDFIKPLEEKSFSMVINQDYSRCIKIDNLTIVYEYKSIKNIRNKKYVPILLRFETVFILVIEDNSLEYTKGVEMRNIPIQLSRVEIMKLREFIKREKI